MKLNFYRKFQFSRNIQVTQYFDNSGTAFLMAGFHIKIHDMAGEQCVFSAHMTGKRSLFLKLWLEFQL